MASSSSSNNGTELTTGNVSPPTFDANSNDTYIVTSDGTSSGAILEQWKYDAETNAWMQIPLGGTECPDPMTRAQLISLRNSSSLMKDCHYVITDYNRGNVGAAEIELHAVDENTLSMMVSVATTFDNVAWQGTYDIDVNRLESLHDNLGNDVYGQNSVDGFPWGVTAVTENELREGILNYTTGTFRENRIGSESTVNMIGGSATGNIFEQNVSVRLTSGIFNQNTVQNDSNVTILSGTNIHNKFGSSVTYNQVGTGYIRYSDLGGNTTFTNGDTNVSDLRSFSSSNIDTTGSTGSITRTTMDGVNASSMRRVDNLIIQECSFGARTHIQIDNAARVRLYRSGGSGAGRYLVSANRELTANYCTVNNHGYIQVTQGELIANYCNTSGLGYISHQSSGVNNVDRLEVNSQANVRFLNSVTGGRIYYSTASSGGSMYQSGNSTNCYIYYSSVSNIGQYYIQNGKDARHYYNDADSRGYIRNYGNSNEQSIMYYCKAYASGFVDHDTLTSRCRYYAVTAGSQSIIRQTGGAVASNCYYSEVHAYYYLLMSLTGVTRFGLSGTGRQSFTGNPAANGTGQRNWT